MPKIFDPTLETQQLATSQYGFSGERLDNLGATEYTLATVVVDTSSSVSSFRQEIEHCVKEVLKACRFSPRADNLMMRVVEFNDSIREVNGFTLLEKLKEDDYNGAFNPCGSTALFDSTYNAIEATAQYGKQLFDQDYTVNAIVVVITDGEDNRSSLAATMIRDQIAQIQRSETLESVRTILVGLNASGSLNTYLTNFKNDAAFDQYEPVQNADAKSIAKLADFISRSISAQSQALGTGGPSQPLTF
jgi:hypothetical protein